MRLSAIHVYPVKSCRGLDLQEAQVDPWGLRGDRRYMLVDGTGRFVTQREEPLLATVAVTPTPDGLVFERDGRRLEVHTPGEGAPRLEVQVWRSTVPARLASTPLGDLLGLDLRLVYLDDPRARTVNPEYGLPDDRVSFADGYPLLVATEASLADLNARLASPMPMARFRPNLVIAGSAPWAEDTWRTIRVGSVTFRVVKPCDRCVITTTDQQSGARDPHSEPLRTLATFRRQGEKVLFGQNLIPDSTGPIHIGDPVEVEGTPPSL